MHLAAKLNEQEVSMSSFHATIDTTVPRSLDLKAVKSFAEFYPFYLTEHRDRT